MKTAQFRLYLGNPVTLFSALTLPLLCFAPIAMGVAAFTLEISYLSIFLLMCGILGTGVMLLYMQQIWRNLYSYVLFTSSGILIHTLFQHLQQTDYNSFADIGVGSYIHGILNSKAGTQFWFIYFSKQKLSTDEKLNINRLRISSAFVKVRWSDRTFRQLQSILPEKQRKQLEKSVYHNMGWRVDN